MQANLCTRFCGQNEAIKNNHKNNHGHTKTTTGKAGQNRKRQKDKSPASLEISRAKQGKTGCVWTINFILLYNSGPRGRGFKSRHSDHYKPLQFQPLRGFYILWILRLDRKNNHKNNHGLIILTFPARKNPPLIAGI